MERKGGAEQLPSYRQGDLRRTRFFGSMKYIYLLSFTAICYVTSAFMPVQSSSTLPQWIGHKVFWRKPSIEQRALKILTENPLIDGHNDLAIVVRLNFGNEIYKSKFTHPFEKGGMPFHVDLPRLDSGKVGGAFWSAFIPCQKDIFDFSDEAYAPIVQATLSQIDLYHRLAAQYPRYFTTPATADQGLHNWKHKHELISPLAIEGLHQIGNSLSTLRMYHALGVRYSTLTWNCHNAYADAAVLTFMDNGTSIKAPPYWHGVSKPGRRLIHEMNRLGMLVDISHVSADTMRDILTGDAEDTTTKSASDVPGPNTTAWTGSIAPPIFSHSSAYAICPHPRNVPDDVLRLVKRRNALVMVNFSPDFIACKAAPPDSPTGMPDPYPQNATLAQVVRHIVHIGELIGYEHVGLGSDFDGIQEAPRGLDDVSKFPNLVAELLRQGVSDENVAKVVGRNLLRVWSEVDRVSRVMKDKGWLPAEDKLKPWTPETDMSL